MTKRHLWFASSFVLVTLTCVTAFASGAEGHGPDWGRLGSSIVNFIVYIGLIVYFAGPKIQGAFAGRKTALMASIEAAKAKMEAATKQLQASETRLATLSAEREQLLADARTTGARDRDRSIAAGADSAAKIATDAMVQAEAASRRLARTLEARLVDRALELARDDLKTRLNAESQARLVSTGIREIHSSDAGARA